MKKFKIILASILTSLLFSYCSDSDNEIEDNNSEAMKNEVLAAPDVEKKPKEIITHGTTRIDDYYWLKDRENGEVLDYLKAENSYTDKVLAPVADLQEEVFQEMKSRLKEDDDSAPYFENGYFYKRKFEKGKEYAIYVRSKDAEFKNSEVLLDCNELAEGAEFFQMGSFEISPDNDWMVYATDKFSRRLYDLYLKNLVTGEVKPLGITNNDTDFAWANDNETLFFSTKDTVTLRTDKIYKLDVLNPANKALVYEEKDDTFSCYVYKSKSNQFIFLQSYSTLSSEVRFLNADDPHSYFKLFQERLDNVEYNIFHQENRFIIRTNSVGATNFKLMECAVDNTAIENWKLIQPHHNDVLIEDVEVFKSFYAVSELEQGLNKIKIVFNDPENFFYIDYNDDTYVAYPANNPNYLSNAIRIWYSSLTTPSKTYQLDVNSKEESILKQTEIQGGYDASAFTSERIWCEARDGVKVPISLVYKKNLKTEVPSPTLLYAYGSYGSSTLPYFSSSRLSLLDRGFIFAIAHVRGGEELGRAWYEEGKMLNKYNTFNDFIDCGKYLVEKNYTDSSHLYAMGGSAGGLLMGVVANDAPELFNGIIAAVPFVDVVTTMLDETIPLTTSEYDEWGNPNDLEYFNYMLSYSPYDQVKKQAYPNMLITTGLHDSQVQYWEPAKWTAKLRDNHTGENIILLKTNMQAGHGGASGRYAYLKEVAEEYAFLIGLETKQIP